MVVRRRSRALQHPFELWGVDDEDLLAERLTRGKRRGGAGAYDGVRSGRRHVVGGQPERRCHGGGGRIRRCRVPRRGPVSPPPPPPPGGGAGGTWRPAGPRPPAPRRPPRPA